LQASLLLAKRAPADAQVLVAGAGGGLELRALAAAHEGWHFVGVDPAAEMLSLAAETLGPLAPRAQLIEGYAADALGRLRLIKTAAALRAGRATGTHPAPTTSMPKNPSGVGGRVTGSRPPQDRCNRLHIVDYNVYYKSQGERRRRLMVRLADVGRPIGDAAAPAVGDGARLLDYGELDRRCDQFAGGLLAMGLCAGDRLALLAPSSPDFVVAYLGAHRAGLVVLPLNPLLSVPELIHILRAMQPSAIVAPPAAASPLPAIQGLVAARDAGVPQARLIYTDLAPDAAAAAGAVAIGGLGGPPPRADTGRHPDDEAVILFTSGTSGRPKGVSLSERSLVTNAQAAAGVLSCGPKDILLCPLPLSHVFGQVAAMLGGLLAGARLELVPRPTPDLVFRAMVATSPTLMLAVPTTVAALAKIGAEAEPSLTAAAGRHLRQVGTGGASLPAATRSDFTAVFGAPVTQGYGMTESAGVISLGAPEPSQTGADVGRILDTFEYRVEALAPAEPHRGELLLRGPNLLRGYYAEGSFEARQPQQWFATGDLVDIAPDGRVTLFDRKKELIIRGGYNVYPSEVEAVLTAHPQVSLAAVVGLPHPDLGQEVAAFVTLKSPGAATEDDLSAWCKAQLSLYKYPRAIRILDSLPLSPTGKVLKRDLPVGPLSA